MYTLIKKLLREGLLLEITIGDAWSKFYSDTTKFPALNGSIELFNKLNDLYPRNGDNFNKSYFNWLYSLLRNGKLKEEDFYKAKEYLGTFVKFYNRIPQEGRDINQYKSLPELYNVVKDYIGSDEPTSKSDEKRQIKNEEIEKVFEDEDFLIMIPKTERASCLIGKGTQWCTAAVVSNNMFNSYNDQGPLYVIIDKDNNNKYQLHFESNQLMDAEDRSIGGCYFFEEIVNDSVFDFLQTRYERFWDFILETSVEDIVDGGYCEMFTDALSSEVTPSVLSDVLSKLRGGNDSSAIYTGFVYEKDPNEIDNDDLVNLFDNEYIDPEDLEGIMSHLEAIKYDFENYEVNDNPVSKYREAMLGLSKNKLEIGINYQTDKGRELIINKINIFNPEKPYNITVNKETGNVDIETLVNYIHQGQLFESKSIIKKLLKKLFISEITIFENKLNKRFIKKLIRENLVKDNKRHNHKLCNVCRLKSITINENTNTILTEEQKINKLDRILLMLEKEIKVGDNLTKKLNYINSDLSKKLLAFFNSDLIKDTAEVEYVDYDKNNEKLFTLGYTDRNGNEKTRLMKINKLLNYLGSSIENIKDYEIEDLMSHLKKADTTQLKMVEGDDILWAYHCANYDEGENMGSCMRFDAAQEYLKIYTENPNEVKCLVLINPENDKVRGRALIWHMDNDQYFMDRVYTTNKEFNAFFNNYAEENGISKRVNSTVTLENGGVYDTYPYMDTFEYYDPETATLATSGEQGWLRLQDTHGGHASAGVYIEYGNRKGDTVDEDEAYYISYRTSDGYREGYAHQDDIIGIDGEAYLIDDCIQTYDNEWVYKYDDESYTIELTHGRYEGEYAKLDDTVELEPNYYGEGQYITHEDDYLQLDDDIYEVPHAFSDDTVETFDEKTILKSDAVELYRAHYGEAIFAHPNDATKVNTNDYGDVWVLDTDLDEFEEKEREREERDKNIDLENLAQNLKNGLITQSEYDEFVRKNSKHNVTESKSIIKKLLRKSLIAEDMWLKI